MALPAATGLALFRAGRAGEQHKEAWMYKGTLIALAPRLSSPASIGKLRLRPCLCCRHARHTPHGVRRVGPRTALWTQSRSRVGPQMGPQQ